MRAIWGWVGAGLIVVGGLLTPSSGAFGARGKGGGGRPAAHRSAPRPHPPSRSTYRPPKPPSHPSRPRAAAPRRSAPKPAHHSSVPASRPKAHPSASTPHPSRSAATHSTRVRTAGPTARAPRSTRTTTVRRPSRHHPGRRYTHRGGVRLSRGWGYSRRYAVSNGNVRAIVGRLRATHSGLSRLDRDYNGHRARAMRSIRRAVRLLTHSSRGLRTSTTGRRGGATMPQAQSDTMMRRGLQTLRGVHVQMTRNALMSSHNAARASVRRAIRELEVGLRVR